MEIRDVVSPGIPGPAGTITPGARDALAAGIVARDAAIAARVGSENARDQAEQFAGTTVALQDASMHDILGDDLSAFTTLLLGMVPYISVWDGTSYPPPKGRVTFFQGTLDPGQTMRAGDVWVNPDVTTMASVVAAMRDSSSELRAATVDALSQRVNLTIHPESTAATQGLAAFGTWPNQAFAFLLPKGGTSALRFVGRVPEGWVTASLVVEWLHAVSAVNPAARINLSMRRLDGTGLGALDTTTSNRVSAGPMLLNTITHENRPVTAGRSIVGTIQRNSSNAADTIDGPIGIVSATLVRVS